MQDCKVWILAEQHQGKVQRISFELLTRGLDLAKKINSGLGAIIFVDKIEPEGLQELTDRGADSVLVYTAPELSHFLIEPYANCLLQAIRQYEPAIILAGATSTGRTLMPYVAIRANAGLTADCTSLDIESGTGLLLQTRPAIGGNIMATIKTPHHRPQMATVRPRSTPPAPRQPGRKGQILTQQALKENLASRITLEKLIPNPEKNKISDADTVVVIGRGIKRAENIPMIQELADLLGAALGATRDVVDRGWLSYPHQVGLSGQTISPKLYLGIGVSGSIQHLAGMQTSEKIVAINNNPDAQIFKVADVGIVGDLFQVVPELIKGLKK